MRHDERKEPNANCTQWKPRIGEKKLAVGVGSLGFEAQDHGDLRGQENLREEYVERSRECNASV